MYSNKSYRLTKKEYNYLLPTSVKKRLLNKAEIDKHYFCGSPDELSDMLSRLKGLYNYFGDLNKAIDHKCFITGNLIPFRLEVKF